MKKFLSLFLKNVSQQIINNSLKLANFKCQMQNYIIYRKYQGIVNTAD